MTLHSLNANQMPPPFSTQILFTCSLVAVFAVAGCTNKENVEPNEPCATTVTVRLCPGRTSVCHTEHTTLELADGSRLRPAGPVWESYESRQREGQVLTVGYKRTLCNDIGSDCIDEAAISCLKE
jgi:hypothetical protein